MTWLGLSIVGTWRAHGQTPRGEAELLEGVGQGTPVELALELGERALADEQWELAGKHFERALLHAPNDSSIVARILGTLAAEDPMTQEARTLWGQHWFELASDGEGRVKVPAHLRSALGADPWAGKVLSARVAALAELQRFAQDQDKNRSRRPEVRLLGNWAARLAMDLASPVPALNAGIDFELGPQVHVGPSDHKPVLAALSKLMRTSLGTSSTGMAMRAARSLHGLAVQADFKDLKGPRPKGMGAVRKDAGRGLSKARAQQRERSPDPWSVEDLEWLESEEGEAFTRAHDSFAYPGQAYSPREWYRVETDCGFETLLGVATTIELHHQRLAGWYGQDPFVDQQGIVRIVPEPNGLESEGAPFWWAAGFQGGNTTVMRFAQGNIEGLGHGLTHELTHRFDGALYPGQPSWLTEGKAVWTASAYGPSTDESFVEHHVNFATMQSVWIDGWGKPVKLKTLITGDLEDYRANYSAGYCLYVYLNTMVKSEGEGRLFQESLQRFMEAGRGRKSKPIDFFVDHFCDGEQGRPDGFTAFAEGYEEFLRGFWWKERADWTARYTQSVPRTPAQPFVYDEPTWTWQRNRAEPYFGQDQARVAARVLLDAGQERDALGALLWSLGVDGREPRCLRWLGDVLPGLGHQDAAWVAEHGLVFPGWPAEEEAPFGRKLLKTQALLGVLAQAARDYSNQGLPLSAAALAADHDRLALWLGKPRLRFEQVDPEDLRHPFDRPASLIGARGWVEDELVGYDKKRVVGLWHELEDGDLLVGRRAKRSGTGKLDRSGGGMAFTRSQDYQLPGTYRLETKVHFTTSHGRGQIILGYQRRDRSLRFTFSGGAFMYAVGEGDEEPVFDTIAWNLSGMWERDGALSGSTCGGSIDFGKKRTSFDLVLLVDGASVQAFVDGREVGTYHTADGRPIEGHIGFASSHGAFQFKTPRVQRLERSRGADVPDLLPAGLHLDRPSSPAFENMENRSVYGLKPSSNGSLLLWIPTPWTGPGESVHPEPEGGPVTRRTLESTRRLSKSLQRSGATQPVAIALPECLGEESLDYLRGELAGWFDPPARVFAHPYTAAPPAGLADAVDLNKRWIFFIDAAGVARVVSPLFSVEGGFEPRLAHWLTVFKDHGRPARDLPVPVRESERAAEEGETDED